MLSASDYKLIDTAASTGNVALENIGRKKEIFKRLVADGELIADVCESLGVSPATCYQSITSLAKRCTGKSDTLRTLRMKSTAERIAITNKAMTLNRVKRFHNAEDYQ